MSNVSSNCAVAPPPITGGGMPAAQSPMQVPLQGGGASGGVQSPVQGPVQGGGAQSPMQVPASSAVQGAAGGGQLVQPAAPAAPAAGTPGVATTVPAPTPAPATTPAPTAGTPGVATSDPAAGAQPTAPVQGGGPVDLATVGPVIQQLVTTLSQLVTTLQAQLPQAQAQAGATGVQGGGGAVAGESGAGAVEGGGGPVQQAPAGCGCGGGAAKGAADGVQQGVSDARPDRGAAPAGAAPAGAAGAVGGKIDGAGLTVKGSTMNAEQRRLAEIVLRTGKEMGANRKVLETAVATMIQESVIRNDASVDTKDHDSLGLFQQRPSQGWGTREQISDPAYAARKFFEKAIPNDAKDPDQAKTRLAQSVQISAYPDAYARWDREAEAIVADYNG